MSKRIVFIMPRQVLQKNYGKPVSGTVKARYNLSPGDKTLVKIEGDEFLSQMTWGLIPFKSKQVKDFESLTCIDIKNLKEVVSKNSKRCIIPASGFIDWNEKEEPVYINYTRYPHFAFAGICESWDLGSGKQMNSFGILCQEMDSPMMHISGQIPLTLSAQDSKIWLDDDDIRVEDTKTFMINPGHMQVNPISKDILDPAQDHPGLLKKGNAMDAGENYKLF